MAIDKRRLRIQTESGTYDTLHLETSSDIVKRPDESSVESALVTVEAHTANANVHVTAADKEGWNTKTQLLSETPLSGSAPVTAEVAGRIYPVSLDHNGNLAVVVPWEDTPTVIVKRTVTLAAANWSSNEQTVTVQGISADESTQMIQPVPASASREAYEDANVLATAQAANALTFSCDTTPTVDLTVYVVITEVSSE